MVADLAPERARIGLIIPSVNRLTEPQFSRYAPAGVYPHVTRLRMVGEHHVPLLDLAPRIAEAAGLLADAGCDIIAFHCTASSMEAGIAADREVVDTIRRVTGRPATSTGQAIVAALQALDIGRVVMLSPYDHDGHEHEIDFLTEAGLDVVRDRTMRLSGPPAYAAAPPSFWLQAVIEEQDPRADAYFLGCTTIHSTEIIEEIEAELGKPAVTSNQATLWYCLRACGIADAVPGLGRLMQLDLPAAVAW